MSHWLTNRGKLLLLQGTWDDTGATLIRMGLLAGASTPASIDTEAEIQDFNTVTDLLGAAGVAEATGGWYSRKNLSRTNVTEDDTNNRANLTIATVTWTAATAGQTIYGGFWYDATTDTNDTTRQFCGLVLWTPVPLNGSDFALTGGDLVRGV